MMEDKQESQEGICLLLENRNALLKKIPQVTNLVIKNIYKCSI